MKLKAIAVTCSALMMLSGAAMAYDGTHCSAPGVCWQPKPGFPEKVAGTKYDPKYDQKELDKQQIALDAMAKRNAEKTAEFKKTGKWPGAAIQ